MSLDPYWNEDINVDLDRDICKKTVLVTIKVWFG